jgi:hypothetical protein
LQASGSAQEPIVAFEEAADHFEKRMRRYKRKLKSHRTGAGNGSATDIAYTVVRRSVTTRTRFRRISRRRSSPNQPWP